MKKEEIANHSIKVSIPLTNGTGKTRIKKRSMLNEYGIPVATRQVCFTQSCYVEWQIGYDIDATEQNKVLTTLTNKTFIGANGKAKYLYELSEYIKYFYNWKIISRDDIISIRDYLVNLPPNSYIDIHPDLSIKRSHFIDKKINGFNFYFTRVEYPLLVYKFNQYEIITEIMIKEKQHAVGTQPMLYLCFPITELKNSENILGRVAKPKEKADFIIDENNIKVFLETLKIFGTLAASNNQDAISILNLILD